VFPGADNSALLWSVMQLLGPPPDKVLRESELAHVYFGSQAAGRTFLKHHIDETTKFEVLYAFYQIAAWFILLIGGKAVRPPREAPQCSVGAIFTHAWK
jgi:hypothetical protein